MSGLLTWSDLFGYTSIAAWLGAQFPQVLENIRRQSCEGLALPFLANWLLGDFSNLVGCILTGQLPFQRWLATYFVFVDCMLVAQYFYYAHGDTTPTHKHIRVATASGRRSSVERAPSRYRTLSAAAANVAVAAALAAEYDEHAERRRGLGKGRRGSSQIQGGVGVVGGGEEEEVDEGTLAALADSFHSEGGRDIGRTRYTFSTERRGRGGSTGPLSARQVSGLQPLTSTESLGGRGRSLNRDAQLEHDLEAGRGTNRRSSKASRKSSTMVFLSVWALLGVGTMVNHNRPFVGMGKGVQQTGQVLSPLPPMITPIIPFANVDVGVGKPAIIPEFQNVKLSSDGHVLFVDEPGHDHPPNAPPSNERILGRIFAWLCTTLYLTSRLPQIWKNYARKSVEGLSMYLFVFAFLGNVFYVASIITSPQMSAPPPISSEFLRESIPYLLGSGGTLMFDVTIVSQSFIYRPKPTRRHGQGHGHTAMRSHSRHTLPEEEAGLLSGDLNDEVVGVHESMVDHGSSSKSTMNYPTPSQLRSLVLDYLCHGCYTSTAKAFAKDSTVRHVDADGDEIITTTPAEDDAGRMFRELVDQVELRENIRTHILSGLVDEAIELINRHFPPVLDMSNDSSMSNANPATQPGSSDDSSPSSSSSSSFTYSLSTSIEPSHLLLNLRILAFIEACRTTPLPYHHPKSIDHSTRTPTPSEYNSLPPEGPRQPQPEHHQQQIHLLFSLQKLHTMVSALKKPGDRKAFSEELKNVGGLLLYRGQEVNPLSRYLGQERREAVADQVNAAILCRTGQPTVSALELVIRSNAVIWGYGHRYNLKPRPGAVMPPSKARYFPANPKTGEKEEVSVMSFSLHGCEFDIPMQWVDCPAI
ncbi:hypothetical protein BDN72DRAFT_756006 [Pluteus cervinus]|uniref:Uncharacterized protein n=1 Tax=Pluteus cervinus TaxID=181527 RepID=A0ACD3BFE4_9AGAR|nr:hypothetical protein BDN72DRAFT_756006 [Pluteus cervinus]